MRGARMLDKTTRGAALVPSLGRSIEAFAAPVRPRSGRARVAAARERCVRGAIGHAWPHVAVAGARAALLRPRGGAEAGARWRVPPATPASERAVARAVANRGLCRPVLGWR
jgi:hypothetical protein